MILKLLMHVINAHQMLLLVQVLLKHYLVQEDIILMQLQHVSNVQLVFLYVIYHQHNQVVPLDFQLLMKFVQHVQLILLPVQLLLTELIVKMDFI